MSSRSGAGFLNATGLNAKVRTLKRRPKGISWDTLRYLHHIAEYGSFLEAAEHLHCTQAHLSIKIAQLEAHLGFSLFQRTDRGVFPTRKDQEFLAILSPFMHDLHGASQIGARENGRRTLRIVATHAVMRQNLG